ncbi:MULTISPECIES: arsenic resistance protein [Halomonadaceae]|jgi:ACR3 family arsenite efflux pump ArsB|uniref:Arsenic resistance protein n=1 Tax=Vreelandella janggokensis TaxID=370767 RepID=A0ABT4IW43_9GAMM|nr:MULTISPECIES: arsenic resistance protein [Halomonas]MCW4148919.1 arsenic resistance protein [Halomonas sp. 18H]MCZ0927900.1 arsenic resistance protein [Halomonas janggokensis]MCZ0930642.1 arsenic resistance protein [Halomonas janggokensis]MDR5884557.1 arsenic resistance protein [Halomonas janggokensis]QPL48188.1 arsenic resistance protein [Halomonas sp. A40-4]
MRETLEKYQVWLYLVAILAGIGLGARWEVIQAWNVALWPLLGLLLYATFTQVPLLHIPQAFKDRRFMSALALGNFIVMPLVVWGLATLFGLKGAVLLGVLLVLLVPCTDWFISFTHLGQGDSAKAIAATPVLLLLQITLLPLYVTLMMGEQLVSDHLLSELLPAFWGLIVTPLLLAWLTETGAAQSAVLKRGVEVMGWLPVPLLTAVVFLIAASQVHLIIESQEMLGQIAVLFVLYLLVAALVGKTLHMLFRLPTASGRTLVFSLGTRNSFVVLPLAIALPDIWAASVVVIVLQSLVELLGMVTYLAWVPRLVKHSPADTREY